MNETTPAKSREHAELERQYGELLQVCAAMKVERDEARATITNFLAQCDGGYIDMRDGDARNDETQECLNELRAVVAPPFRGLEMDSKGKFSEVGDGE